MHDDQSRHREALLLWSVLQAAFHWRAVTEQHDVHFGDAVQKKKSGPDVFWYKLVMLKFVAFSLYFDHVHQALMTMYENVFSL